MIHGTQKNSMVRSMFLIAPETKPSEKSEAPIAFGALGV